MIACITQHYPDFLANTPIMVQAQDYVGQKAKADRAYILAAMYAFLHKKFDKRENVKLKSQEYHPKYLVLFSIYYSDKRRGS